VEIKDQLGFLGQPLQITRLFDMTTFEVAISFSYQFV